MPSTWRKRLSDEQIDVLDTLRMKTLRAAVFRNCTMILMSDAGRSKDSIAEDLGCGTATVERVRRLYKTLGIGGLTPIKPPGRPSRLSEALREPVLEAVQTDPRTLGYGFTTWSVARLTEHLGRRRRLRASPSTVRRVLAHEQFSFQRPKHTLEGNLDENAHAKAKKELSGLKKSAPQERSRSAGIPRRNRNPHAPVVNADVGEDRAPTTGSLSRSKPKEGGVWRSGLRHGKDHDDHRRHQERAQLHRVPGHAGSFVRGAQDSSGVRQRTISAYPRRAGLAGWSSAMA